MNRIKKAFEKKAFIGFLTGGDPTVEKTKEYIMEMVKGGADLIEIGIPFSDPIAEGAVIQAANLRALNNSATTDKMFDIVVEVRKETQVPIVFLTYLNPVFHYGYEQFFAKCEVVGLDGIIIPDLPFEEKEEVAVVARRYGVSLISLIAPNSKERIQMIAKEAEGFIYVVSSMGVTGVRNEISSNIEEVIATIKEVTKVPCAVGFGINSPQQAESVAQYADGVIVGSAIVKIIEKYGEEAGALINKYVSEMKAATKGN